MPEKQPPLVSIVVPAYNEIENLPLLYEELQKVFSDTDRSWELLVVDDASTDGTLQWLRELSRKDPRVRFVSFSRNFGHQAGVTAGLQYACGKAVIVMDADLQDPPELLPEMIRQWQEGNQIVIAKRRSREGESFLKRFFAWAYYRLLSRLSETGVHLDAGDFCLMDRRVVDELNAMPERNRYIRGLRAWVGFKTVEVPFDRKARHAGEVKYTFSKSLRLALDGILSLSQKPLRLATYLGLITGGFSLVMVGLVIYWRFFTESPLVGYAMIVTAILVIGSIQLLVIGIVGEYVGRIYNEVKGRPHFVVKEASPDEVSQEQSLP